NGFPSLTPLSVAQQIGVRKSSAGVIYSFKGGQGTAQHRKPCRFSAVACGGNLGFFFSITANCRQWNGAILAEHS
ncbi:MAG TPA: hypothetical protein VK755_04285, partial [Candidatus Acidoferrales bacterium]|nr:hypothetical protein [Candidatus Acidoferrales bacterium]